MNFGETRRFGRGHALSIPAWTLGATGSARHPVCGRPAVLTSGSVVVCGALDGGASVIASAGIGSQRSEAVFDRKNRIEFPPWPDEFHDRSQMRARPMDQATHYCL